MAYYRATVRATLIKLPEKTASTSMVGRSHLERLLDPTLLSAEEIRIDEFLSRDYRRETTGSEVTVQLFEIHHHMVVEFDITEIDVDDISKAPAAISSLLKENMRDCAFRRIEILSMSKVR